MELLFLILQQMALVKMDQETVDSVSLDSLVQIVQVVLKVLRKLKFLREFLTYV